MLFALRTFPRRVLSFLLPVIHQIPGVSPPGTSYLSLSADGYSCPRSPLSLKGKSPVVLDTQAFINRRPVSPSSVVVSACSLVQMNVSARSQDRFSSCNLLRVNLHNSLNIHSAMVRIARFCKMTLEKMYYLQRLPTTPSHNAPLLNLTWAVFDYRPQKINSCGLI
ncbi:hypothetical protein J6590_084056 [Homalodisca vitripennis]|nr:hypothetical protein J6590_084056 [Homalodisca vitripennis]